MSNTYSNPIILCDYSDPDLIRVGNTFYMTASSFNFMPGLPILTSQDLVHWTLANYAARSLPLPQYDRPQNAKGLWAPSIRYHAGRFYIFVASPDEGIFVTETSDPLGEWTPLRLIWQGRGFEDPCPLWDDDGSVYLVHAYVKSRIGFNSKLGLLRLDPRTLDAVSEDKVIFDGRVSQPTIEGPKFYKREGCYYIFAPAGGVSEGWQTVLRSRRIDGDYQERIVLRQGKSPINGPHQGGLVDTAAGEDWFIHFQERGIFGRILHLQPVAWKDGWPLMGTAVESGAQCGEPYTSYRLPDCSRPGPDGGAMPAAAGIRQAGAHAAADEKLHWQWSANPQDHFARFNKDGSISLSLLNTAAATGFPLLWQSANVLTQKIRAENFTFSASFDISALPPGARTGIVFMGDDYASLALERSGENAGGYSLVYFESESAGGDDERSETVKARLPLPPQAVQAGRLQLSLTFTKCDERRGSVSFTAACGRGSGAGCINWQPQTEPYVTKNAHWVGGRFGLYALRAGRADAAASGFPQISVSDICIKS